MFQLSGSCARITKTAPDLRLCCIRCRQQEGLRLVLLRPPPPTLEGRRCACHACCAVLRHASQTSPSVAGAAQRTRKLGSAAFRPPCLIPNLKDGWEGFLRQVCGRLGVGPGESPVHVIHRHRALAKIRGLGPPGLFGSPTGYSCVLFDRVAGSWVMFGWGTLALRVVWSSA